MLLRRVAPVACFASLVLALGVATQAQAPAAAATATGEAPPRWPDGRVNLGSTADHKGYWEVRPGLGGFPRAADVPFQPWARGLYQYRSSRTDLHPPLVRCKPASGSIGGRERFCPRTEACSPCPMAPTRYSGSR